LNDVFLTGDYLVEKQRELENNWETLQQSRVALILAS